jgi:aspartate-semialdehyde dehydrogenase
VLSSAGGAVSRALLPRAAAAGAVCIDNTSAFRMEPHVPLVVPEVNGHRLHGIQLGDGGAIIANPNCSTIQLVAALKPIHDAARVRRVVVSTYQSISGAGRGALERFRGATTAILDGAHEPPEPLEGTAAFDAIPDIGGLDEEGHSVEERKMAAETPRILEAPIELDVCCVRIPVFTGHAESVLVETAEPLSVAAARALLACSPGIALEQGGAYPTPRAVDGDPAVHVGRIRSSQTTTNGLLMWIVADNLLKGAALNAVQIAEQVIEQSRTTAPEDAPTSATV